MTQSKGQKPKQLDRTPKPFRVKAKAGEINCAGIQFTASFQEVQLDPHGSAFKSISGHHRLVIEKVVDNTATQPVSTEKAD